MDSLRQLTISPSPQRTPSPKTRGRRQIGRRRNVETEGGREVVMEEEGVEGSVGCDSIIERWS